LFSSRFQGILVVTQPVQQGFRNQEKIMAGKRVQRVYVDTSVVGGTFDKEFDWQTEPFWDAVRQGKILIIIFRPASW